MPLNIDFVQILLHMLNFVILAGGLTFLLYKPVVKFLEERRTHFETLEKENDEKAKENERVKAEYERKLKEADKEIADKRLKAENESADAAKAYMDTARQQAADLIIAAEKEAEERKEHILESAQTEIGEMVIEAEQKLLNQTASQERASELYDRFIETTSPKKA